MDRLFQMLLFTSNVGAVNVTQTSAQTWLIQTRVLLLNSPMKERNGFDTSLLVLLACLQLHAVFLYVSQWFCPLQIAPSLYSLTPHWGCCFDQIHQSTKSPPALGLGSLCVWLKWFSWAFISTASNHLCTILLNCARLYWNWRFDGLYGAQEAPCDVDGQLPVDDIFLFLWLVLDTSWLKYSAQSSCVKFSGFSLGQNPIRRKRAAIQISLLSSYFTSVPLGSDLVNN